MDSDYQSVNEQTGIFAGKGGFDIKVVGNTDLDGSVLGSEAEANKNKLSTGTLTFSDIENKAEYKAESNGVGNATGPNLGVPVSDDKTSTTHAAIAQGTIEIKDQANQKADITKLSRDTQNAVNKLDQIFDKKTVQEKQELANLFSQEAVKLVGDIAEREKDRLVDKIINAKNDTEREEAKKEYQLWMESGTNKVLLHAFVGGLTAKFAGGDFLSGAAGAGFNEVVQQELKNIKNPTLHQLASALVGGAATEILGGDAQTGAVTALNGTKYNFLSHWQKEQRDKAIAAGEWDKVVYWNAVDKAQNQIINAMGLLPGIDLNVPENYNLLQTVSRLAQEALANQDLAPGDYDGFKITPVGEIVVLVGVTWIAIHVDWKTLRLGLPVLAKPINLPAWREIAIDMEHVASGHMVGGSRVSQIKDLFPNYMNTQQVERVIREAYRYGEKVSTQGDKVLIRGTSNGMTIEMYVNTVTKTIETAYPKW